MIYKTGIKAISTFFFIGYLPLIPGTFASLAGLSLFLACGLSTPSYFISVFCLCLVGFLVCGKAENVFQRKDPPYIVIDEVSGMLLSLASVFFLKMGVMGLWLAFFLFRLLDTIKPYPANKIQHLHGSLGVMGDDLIAALYTNIILQLVFRFTS